MTERKPTVPEVLPKVKAYLKLPGNIIGGSLHAYLDDGNTKESDIRWCLEYAQERGDKEGIELAEILLRMSRTQRIKIADRAYDP